MCGNKTGCSTHSVSNYYGHRGHSYMIKYEFEKAIQDLNISISLCPNKSSAIAKRAYCKMKLGLPYCEDYKRACQMGYKYACREGKEFGCTNY